LNEGPPFRYVLHHVVVVSMVGLLRLLSCLCLFLPLHPGPSSGFLTDNLIVVDLVEGLGLLLLGVVVLEASMYLL